MWMAEIAWIWVLGRFTLCGGRKGEEGSAICIYAQELISDEYLTINDDLEKISLIRTISISTIT